MNRNEGQMGADAYEMSRIYGHGWNAAKQLLSDGGEHPDGKQAAALNPYRGADERARWSKGFEDGLRSRTGSHTMSKLKSWRAQGTK